MIEFSVFKTVFRLRFDFFAAVAVLILFYEQKIALWGLCAALIHEAGHLLAMTLCDVPVRCVMFYGAGICIDTKNRREFLPPLTDIIILAAGAAVNFAVFAYFTLLFESVSVHLFGAVNLVIGLFNLLPLSQFDGGRIISAIIFAVCPQGKAEKLDFFRQKMDFFIIPAVAIIFFILGNRNILLYVTLTYFMAVTVTYNIKKKFGESD
jgi:Zn-dependent protease